MWTRQQSITLSKLCIWLFMGLMIAVVLAAPWLTNWLIDFSRADLIGKEDFFLATIYAGSAPGAYLLYNLLRLLNRIDTGAVFISENVDRLRRISWSCFIGAAIALVSAVYYFPWLFVAAPAAFMGLIVRVVKDVVTQAAVLQEEVDSII